MIFALPDESKRWFSLETNRHDGHGVIRAAQAGVHYSRVRDNEVGEVLVKKTNKARPGRLQWCAGVADDYRKSKKRRQS